MHIVVWINRELVLEILEQIFERRLFIESVQTILSNLRM